MTRHFRLLRAWFRDDELARKRLEYLAERRD